MARARGLGSVCQPWVMLPTYPPGYGGLSAAFRRAPALLAGGAGGRAPQSPWICGQGSVAKLDTRKKSSAINPTVWIWTAMGRRDWSRHHLVQLISPAGALRAVSPGKRICST